MACAEQTGQLLMDAGSAGWSKTVDVSDAMAEAVAKAVKTLHDSGATFRMFLRDAGLPVIVQDEVRFDHLRRYVMGMTHGLPEPDSGWSEHDEDWWIMEFRFVRRSDYLVFPVTGDNGIAFVLEHDGHLRSNLKIPLPIKGMPPLAFVHITLPSVATKDQLDRYLIFGWHESEDCSDTAIAKSAIRECLNAGKQIGCFAGRVIDCDPGWVVESLMEVYPDSKHYFIRGV